MIRKCEINIFRKIHIYNENIIRKDFVNKTENIDNNNF